MRILIVDDQRSARRILSGIAATLPDTEICEADSFDAACRVLREQSIDVALIDVRLSADAGNRDGLKLVAHIRAHTAAVPIIVTVSHEMSEIRTAMRSGAHDYILKDELCEELVVPVLEQLRHRDRLEREVAQLRARVANDRGPSLLVGTSRAMETLRGLIERVALSDRPVLVTGPTGSGKELVVTTLHARGPHPEAPLLDLNCGAIPEALIEAQLFGHERGAFTGADRRQDGYFAAVGEGTLFLDEIAELPLALQAKLLRVLETRKFRPVGSTTEQRFAGRIVAATHADLARRVAEGRFREDLMYRLAVLPLHVPPLEERAEDIPLLVAHFAQHQHRPLRFSPEAMQRLTQQRWPGNVRELRNLIDRLAVFAEADEVTAGVLQKHLAPEASAVTGMEALHDVARKILSMPVANKIDAVEQALLSAAMQLADGNKTAAARLLGVHRKVVERRLGTNVGDE